MPSLLKNTILSIFGLSSGFVIAGAVFAFISVLGVVPRFAQKTRTKRHIRIYENAISIGGVLGTIIGFSRPYLPIGRVLTVVVSLCVGIFYGAIAVSLAEVLNVLPIMARRARLKRGMRLFVVSIALGKAIGSCIYFFVPGHYHY